MEGKSQKGKERVLAATSATRKSDAKKMKKREIKTRSMKETGGQKSRQILESASSTKRAPASKVTSAPIPMT